MSDDEFADKIMVPELVEAGLMDEGDHTREWLCTLGLRRAPSHEAPR